MSTNFKTAAIIVAAGKGLRMGGSVPKQYLKIKDRTILSYTLSAFEQSRTDDIIIVCPEGDEDYVQNEIVGEGSFTKVKAIIAGGAERFDSSYRGIKAAAQIAKYDYILVHDGVRALVEPELIDRVIDALSDTDAVCPAVAVKDTIRMIDGNGDSNGVLRRELLRAVQTPQGFAFTTILKAYELFEEDCTCGKDVSDITDDAMLVERYLGSKVTFTQGSNRNIKITTPEDLAFAKAFLE